MNRCKSRIDKTSIMNHTGFSSITIEKRGVQFTIPQNCIVKSTGKVKGPIALLIEKCKALSLKDVACLGELGVEINII